VSITGRAESVKALPSSRRAPRDVAGGRAGQKRVVRLHANDTFGLIRRYRRLAGKGDHTLAPREARARIVGGHPEAAAGTFEGSVPKRPQLATHIAAIGERGAPSARHDPQSIRLEQATSKGETQAERLITPVSTVKLGTATDQPRQQYRSSPQIATPRAQRACAVSSRAPSCGEPGSREEAAATKRGSGATHCRHRQRGCTGLLRATCGSGPLRRHAQCRRHQAVVARPQRTLLCYCHRRQSPPTRRASKVAGHREARVPIGEAKRR